MHTTSQILGYKAEISLPLLEEDKILKSGRQQVRMEKTQLVLVEGNFNPLAYAEIRANYL